MLLPEMIVDDRVVYHSMRSTLICALQNKVKSILIPLFGAGTGRVPIDVVCKQMFTAYRQIVEDEKRNYIEYNKNK